MPERSGIRSNISGKRVAADLPDQDNSNMTLDLTKIEMKAKVTADLIYPEKDLGNVTIKSQAKDHKDNTSARTGKHGKV